MNLSLNQKLPLGEAEVPTVSIKSENGKTYTFIFDGDIESLEIGGKYKVVHQGWVGKLVTIGIWKLADVTEHKMTDLKRICPKCDIVHDTSETDEVPETIREILSEVFGDFIEKSEKQ